MAFKVGFCRVLCKSCGWLVVDPDLVCHELPRLFSEARFFLRETNKVIEDVMDWGVEAFWATNEGEPAQGLLVICYPNERVHVNPRFRRSAFTRHSVLQIRVDQTALGGLPEGLVVVSKPKRGDAVIRRPILWVCGFWLYTGSVLEPLGLKSHHSAPAAPYPHRIFPSEHITPAGPCSCAGEPREEGQASYHAVEIARGKTVVELEGHDVVDSTCGCIVSPSGRVDVGCEEELGSFDGIEIDVVQVQDLVELDSMLVDWGKGSVAHLSKEGDAFEAFLPVG